MRIYPQVVRSFISGQRVVPTTFPFLSGNMYETVETVRYTARLRVLFFLYRGLYGNYLRTGR